jgi:hypothetical protein
MTFSLLAAEGPFEQAVAAIAQIVLGSAKRR